MPVHAVWGALGTRICGWHNLKNSRLDIRAPLFYASRRATATAGNTPRRIERKFGVQARLNKTGFAPELSA